MANGKTALVDVTVVNCYRRTVRDCSHVPLAVAATAERDKRTKYAVAASYMRYGMLGAAIESTGTFGKTLQYMLLQAESNWNHAHPHEHFTCSLPRWTARRFPAGQHVASATTGASAWP